MNKIEVGDLVRFRGKEMEVNSILTMADGSVIDIVLLSFSDKRILRLNAKGFTKLELIQKSINNLVIGDAKPLVSQVNAQMIRNLRSNINIYLN